MTAGCHLIDLSATCRIIDHGLPETYSFFVFLICFPDSLHSSFTSLISHFQFSLLISLPSNCPFSSSRYCSFFLFSFLLNLQKLLTFYSCLLKLHYDVFQPSYAIFNVLTSFRLFSYICLFVLLTG